MDDTSDNFYGHILLIFWIIIPVILNVLFYLFFWKHSNKQVQLEKILDKRKYHVKWGYRWNGKPYIKNQGWGKNYSTLSKEEYFNKRILYERTNKDGKTEQIHKN